MMLSEIRGVGVALVTPFGSRGEIDYTALEKLIHHVVAGGVDYLVSLGTTGETPTLSDEEKRDILRFTYEKAAGLVPVVVGIGGNNTREIIHSLETYPLDEALAILSVSPYYSKPTQEGLYQHYKAIAAASPKPVILYNVPSRTGRNMTAATTVRLAREVENIVGMKEASGDMTQCMQIVRDKPDDFIIVSGDDMLALAQMGCGMEGIISVAANYMAKDMASMVHAALDGHFDQAREVLYRMMEGFELMFEENNPTGIKTFLAEAGICQNVFRLPIIPPSDALYQKIRIFYTRYAG